MVKGRKVRAMVWKDLSRSDPLVQRRKAKGKIVAAPALRKVVRDVVQGSLESKNASLIMNNQTLQNSTITPADWTYPLPSIGQGTLQYERVGDRARPKALIVKVNVSFTSTTGGFPTLKCSLFIVKHKKFTSQSTLAANLSTESPRLLMDGNGATAAYDGTIRASQYKLNTDIWTQVVRKDFTLSRDQTAPVQGNTYREFVIRIPCPKQLVYLNDTDLLPQNFCPAMALGYTYVNGTPPDTIGTPMQIFAQSFFTYTDA